jgi:hypothetical protein
MIMGFLNSEVGKVVVAAILALILGKVFTAKPKWKKYYEKYRPILMQAVKFAEKQVPDDTENKPKAKLDAALKYVLDLDKKLEAKDKEAMKAAITAVHAEAEVNKNIGA